VNKSVSGAGLSAILLVMVIAFVFVLAAAVIADVERQRRK